MASEDPVAAGPGDGAAPDTGYAAFLKAHDAQTSGAAPATAPSAAASPDTADPGYQAFLAAHDAQSGATPAAPGAAPTAPARARGGGFHFFTPASDEFFHHAAQIPAGVVGAPEQVGALLGKVAPNNPITRGVQAIGEKLHPATQALSDFGNEIAPEPSRDGMTPSQRLAMGAAGVMGDFAPSLVTGGASALRNAALTTGAVASDLPVVGGMGQRLARAAARPVDAGELAQTLDRGMAGFRKAAAPYWAKVDQAGNVSGPAIDALFNTPHGERAYEAARDLAANAGESLPPLAEPAPRVRVSDELMDRIRADNPGSTEAAVQRMAADPQIAQGYARGVLGEPGAQAAPLGPDAAQELPAGHSGVSIPLRGLQSMKRYLNGFIQRGVDSPDGFTVDNAKALQATLYKAIDEATQQAPFYGKARALSGQALALEQPRKALEGMLSPAQRASAMAARGDLPVEAASAPGMFGQSSRAGALPNAVAAAGQLAHGNLLGAGRSALGAVAGLAGQGSRTLTDQQVAELLAKSGKRGAPLVLQALKAAQQAAADRAVLTPGRALQAGAGLRRALSGSRQE